MFANSKEQPETAEPNLIKTRIAESCLESGWQEPDDRGHKLLMLTMVDHKSDHESLKYLLICGVL